MTINETNNFKGIPYADYFSVNVDWLIIASTDDCDCKISLSFVFHKYTLLQGTIESNTKSELKVVYEKWLESALVHIQMLDTDPSVAQIRQPAQEHDIQNSSSNGNLYAQNDTAHQSLDNSSSRGSEDSGVYMTGSADKFNNSEYSEVEIEDEEDDEELVLLQLLCSANAVVQYQTTLIQN